MKKNRDAKYYVFAKYCVRCIRQQNVDEPLHVHQGIAFAKSQHQNVQSTQGIERK